MGHRTTLKPGRTKKSSRPSTFFIVAMLIALAFLAWGFIVLARRPLQPVPAQTNTRLEAPRGCPLT